MKGHRVFRLRRICTLLAFTFLISLFITPIFVEDASGEILTPPFTSAVGDHDSKLYKYNFNIIGSGRAVSIYDPNGNIDEINGTIYQNAFAGSSLLGGNAIVVTDTIDIPIPPAPISGSYDIVIRGTYSYEVKSVSDTYLKIPFTDYGYDFGITASEFDIKLMATIRKDGATWLGDLLNIDSTSLAGTILEILYQGGVEIASLWLSEASDATTVQEAVEYVELIHDIIDDIKPPHKDYNRTFELKARGFLDPAEDYTVRLLVESQASSYAGGLTFMLTNVDVDIQIDEIEIVNSNAPDEIELSINSHPNAGININLDNPDHSGQQNGTTPFSRTFYENEAIQLTAPPTDQDGYPFEAWRVNDIFYSAENPVTITVDKDSIVTASYSTNIWPILVNPYIIPTSGTESTTFEYLVDYYDSDGGIPINKYLYIDGNGPYSMSLKSGSPSDGTYSYQTQLQIGTHDFFFSFIEGNGGVAMSPIYTGPSVFTTNSSLEILAEVDGGPVTDNIEIKFGYGTDLQNLEYQEWVATELPKNLAIDSGQQVMFSVSIEAENHSFTKWVFQDDDGNILRESTSSGYGFVLDSGNIQATAHFTYTPTNYTISGTVLREDGTPVPGGIDLTLTSSQQATIQTSNDGNFSFTEVNGGVSATITPSADGYAFTPSSLVYNNLRGDHTGEEIIAYATDTQVSVTRFLELPPEVSEKSSVTFSWIGEDDVTATADLLYQYKLDGVDTDWSAWDGSTSKSYDLPNGVYTFWVQAKDEAENINQAPANYTFVVDAAPKITSSARINHSVWANRITLEMPISASQPSNIFVLLSDHSGIDDSKLVPVTIHRVDEITPVGANEIVANELGLESMIVEADKGWVVTLPEDITSGQSVQYDIVWGKIGYFGWQDFITREAGFPNGGDFDALYLDDDFKLWRTAVKRDLKGTYACSYDYWLYMDMSDQSGISVDETILRFIRGECLDGTNGTYTEFWDSHIYNTGTNLLFSWTDTEREQQETIYNHFSRYGLQLFDLTGASLSSAEGNYVNHDTIVLPEQLINGELWITGSNSTSNMPWFIVVDVNGTERIPQEEFDIQKGIDFFVNTKAALPIGDNAIFLWERNWETPGGKDRRELVYQIRDSNGSVFKQTASFHPEVAPDSEDAYDRYTIQRSLSDSDGKIWVSYSHTTTGIAPEYYYVIIGADGNIWKGPIQTSGPRLFSFCDRDGYIWATENSQVYVLDSEDNVSVGPRALDWIPNQRVGQVEAEVSLTGYRLYDRWYPRSFVIDVPSGAIANSMELFDLNLWDNGLHPANLSLKKGETSVWSHSGQFTGRTTVDMSGMLNQGPNVLTMTQDDFLGGQVLITFPYVIDSDGDGIPDAQDAFPNDPNEWIDSDADGVGNNEDTDDDNDDMPDAWEANYGLNPLVDDASGDADNDGITNLQEYLSDTDPGDSADKPVRPYILSKDCRPHDGQGIDGGTIRVPHDTSIIVIVRSSAGIDKDTVVMKVEGVEVEAVVKEVNNGDNTACWIIYNPEADFDFGQIVDVTIEACDVNTVPMTPPYSFSFGVETEQKYNNAVSDTPAFSINDTNLAEVVVSADEGTAIEGARIIYNSVTEKVTPRFGPTNEIPQLDKTDGIGMPVSLEPPCVFEEPVTIFIPCPDAEDLSSLEVYCYHSGSGWEKASEVDGWMVPGSRVDHPETDPPTIEIQVNHFTGFQAGGSSDGGGDDGDDAGGGSGGAAAGGGGGSSSCFIATAAFGSKMEPHVRILQEFRDRFLLTNSIGKALVDIYYTYSPAIADFIAAHSGLKVLVRWSLLPIVGLSWAAIKIGPIPVLILMLVLITLSAKIVFVIRKRANIEL